MNHRIALVGILSLSIASLFLGFRTFKQLDAPLEAEKLPPAPLQFRDVKTRWEGDEWIISEIVIVTAACGKGTWLLRSFVLRGGGQVPAAPIADTGHLEPRPDPDLSGLVVGEYGPIEVRFRPPPDAIGYLVEAYASPLPAGACTNGFFGRRLVLSLEIERPQKVGALGPGEPVHSH
jgi:hypothetical protein